MAKPMKTLELHYPMIQFLINCYSPFSRISLLPPGRAGNGRVRGLDSVARALRTSLVFGTENYVSFVRGNHGLARTLFQISYSLSPPK